MTCLCCCWHLAKQATRRRAVDRIRTGRGEQCRQYEQAPSCTRRNARSPGCHGRYQKEVIEVKGRIAQAYSDLAAGRKNGEAPDGTVGRHIQSPKEEGRTCVWIGERVRGNDVIVIIEGVQRRCPKRI